MFGYGGGQVLSKPGLGRRERLRVCLTDGEGHDVVLYVKRFGRGTCLERLAGWLRGQRSAAGAREFGNTVALAEAGVSVPRPVAFGCEQGGLAEGRSYVISEELPEAEALERLLPAAEQARQRYKLLGQRRELIEALAALVRQLHEGAGMFHRDLYLSHIFVGRDRSGVERLSLIDLQRVFRPMVRRRWRVKDLAQLYYSARAYGSRSEAMRFLRCYLGVDRLDESQRRLARAVARKAARIERRQARRRG